MYTKSSVLILLQNKTNLLYFKNLLMKILTITNKTATTTPEIKNTIRANFSAKGDLVRFRVLRRLRRH